MGSVVCRNLTHDQDKKTSNFGHHQQENSVFSQSPFTNKKTPYLAQNSEFSLLNQPKFSCCHTFASKLST